MAITPNEAGDSIREMTAYLCHRFAAYLELPRKDLPARSCRVANVRERDIGVFVEERAVSQGQTWQSRLRAGRKSEHLNCSSGFGLRLQGGFFHHDVRVGPAKAKGTDPCDARPFCPLP